VTPGFTRYPEAKKMIFRTEGVELKNVQIASLRD
jgi:hypothetical protein